MRDGRIIPGAVAGETGQEDFAQAEWLAERLDYEWRYDFGAQRWHHFDGIRWAPDKTGGAILAVAEAAVKALAGKGVPQTTGKEARKALLRLLSLPALERALRALSTMPGYGTDGSDWDQDPYLLGCENGIVDLRENALVIPAPDQKVTLNTRTAFRSVASPADFADHAPRFMTFLEQVTSDYDFTPDVGVASFLILWFGASLFGMAPEQRFLLMTGSGRNGKGALKHAILSAIGEYGLQPDGNLYSRTKFGVVSSSSARADLMALKGKRIVMCSEPDQGRFNEEMLKAHTGGDEIVARALYSNTVLTWAPTHSVTFLVNDAPSLDDIGPSVGSRIMVADFRHRFEGEAEDKSLYMTLEKEKEGILGILCWAAKAWYGSWSNGGRGLTLPERVVEQSVEFIERNDPLADCLREAFVVHPLLETPSQKAYEAYLAWFGGADRDGEPLTQSKFAPTLEKKGFRKVKRMSSNVWIGLRPKSDMIVTSEGEVGDD